MLELMQSGGWLMVPILACSIAAAAICIERAWVLQSVRVAPDGLVETVLAGGDAPGVADSGPGGADVPPNSPLGRILAAGLTATRGDRDPMRDPMRAPMRAPMKEAMEGAAGPVVHEMERHLTLLGTIAAISPLLGLLGTVIGMIQVFTTLVVDGAANPGVLAEGISKALVTTAAGLGVAIPALFFHRYFLRRVDELAVTMEHEASRLVEMVCGASGVESNR